MTQWMAKVGEILDTKADALICSANPYLNLSGGVGGAFALRYGNSMQKFLQDWLNEHGQRFATLGTVVVAPSCGSSYRFVMHAVTIDAFYDTSVELIRSTYLSTFDSLAACGCRTVASACLTCGYGRTAPETFVAAVRDLLGTSLPQIWRHVHFNEL